MSKTRQCPLCNNSFPLSVSLCPHCGRPSYYPNVDTANDVSERDALNERYTLAHEEAVRRGTDASLKSFETALADSKAITARSAVEVHRLATDTNEVYATYYQLTEAEVRLPDGDKWDVLRRVADSAFFPGYVKDIRFAALSLDESGPSNYGSCSITWRTDMIAHRASVSEENSTLFVDHHNILMKEAHQLPPGYRATWDERAKLCVAKLSGKIDAATRPDEYFAILLRQGATSADDEFVEVHIWGPLTILAVEQITLNSRANRAERAIIKATNESLRKFGVKVK